MVQMTVLSVMKFTEAQLDKLRAVSPKLEVVQHTGATLETLPDELRQRVNILYGWGGLLHVSHQLPALMWIQAHSAGVNDLQDKPVWESEVVITSINGIHAVPMAEFGLGLILGFNLRLREMLRFQGRAEWANNRWDRFARPELRGSTLGIVGYGTIARELARQAQALGMDVLAVNRSGQRTPARGLLYDAIGDPRAKIPRVIYPTTQLLDMLPQCDYVVVLAPLTPASHHLLSEAAFDAMKPTVLLVSLARGALVDEAALVRALQQGQIAGAALDVFEQEPLPSDSPLWQMDNVIIAPHVAGFSLHYDDRASDVFAENLRRFIAGEPLLNLVDREHGY